MWDPRCLTKLWVSKACYRDTFTFINGFNQYSDSRYYELAKLDHNSIMPYEKIHTDKACSVPSIPLNLNMRVRQKPVSANSLRSGWLDLAYIEAVREQLKPGIDNREHIHWCNCVALTAIMLFYYRFHSHILSPQMNYSAVSSYVGAWGVWKGAYFMKCISYTLIVSTRYIRKLYIINNCYYNIP
jgi:hypothetical protein